MNILGNFLELNSLRVYILRTLMVEFLLCSYIVKSFQ